MTFAQYKKKITELLLKQEFNPGLLGLFTNPAYFARKGLYEEVRHFSPLLKGKMLDIGCGTKPYLGLFKHAVYSGLEIDTPKNRKAGHADFFYEGVSLPFSDETFDSIVSTEVLECVSDPNMFLREIRRTLKPRGALLLTAPFMWSEMPPHDYARYSSIGLTNLLENNGFSILESRKNLPDVRALIELLANYLRGKIRIKNKRLKLMAYMAIFGPLHLFGLLLYALLPKEETLYLHAVVLARKR